MMKRFVIRLCISLLGMVLTLAWWTIRRDNTHTQSASHIPEKVWAGGHTLEVEIDASCATKMSISFSQHDKPDGKQSTLYAVEDVSQGPHSWSVDVPEHVGGYIELDAVKPNPGDTLTMTIKMDGKVVDQQSDKLTSPLTAGYAFFVQRFYDDYSKAADEMVGQEGSSSSNNN